MNIHCMYISPSHQQWTVTTKKRPVLRMNGNCQLPKWRSWKCLAGAWIKRNTTGLKYMATLACIGLHMPWGWLCHLLWWSSLRYFTTQNCQRILEDFPIWNHPATSCNVRTMVHRPAQKTNTFLEVWSHERIVNDDGWSWMIINNHEWSWVIMNAEW